MLYFLQSFSLKQQYRTPYICLCICMCEWASVLQQAYFMKFLKYLRFHTGIQYIALKPILLEFCLTYHTFRLLSISIINNLIVCFFFGLFPLTLLTLMTTSRIAFWLTHYWQSLTQSIKNNYLPKTKHKKTLPFACYSYQNCLLLIINCFILKLIIFLKLRFFFAGQRWW